MEYLPHKSVLLDECVQYLVEPVPNKSESPFVIADLTFGAGGHTQALLDSHSSIHVIGFDQDRQAIENGQKLVQLYPNRLTLIHSNFENVTEELEKQFGEVKLDGVLMDLGISSHQIDEVERGLSFRLDGPLDMRMDQRQTITAKDVVNDWDEEELLEILYKWGEERFAKNIVKNILEKRSQASIETTKELEDIVFHSYPAKLRHHKRHPATKTFQAIRIAVNRELEVLETALDKVSTLIKPNRRFCVISFHSLEDRIVKHFFKNLAKVEQKAKLLHKKPILPKEEELLANNRARSAKLRVIEMIQ